MKKHEAIMFTTREPSADILVLLSWLSMKNSMPYTRRVLVTIKDAPEEEEHRSCEGCIYESQKASITRLTPAICYRCCNFMASSKLRKNWTAPEPAPVPMTKEYALGQIGAQFTTPSGTVHELSAVGEDGAYDTRHEFTTYQALASRGWWTDGTPCAMPQRKDGEE